VLYTTHYMEEAERLCDRIGILDQGDVKAEGTRRELVALVGERDRISLSAPGTLDAAADAARRLDGVASVSARAGGIDVVADDASSLLPRLLSEVSATGAQIGGVEVAQPDLEAVFLHLTGKALRD
jgi:ABC-2 type transport system ATP-binding protein